jgi:hypothetical protein
LENSEFLPAAHKDRRHHGHRADRISESRRAARQNQNPVLKLNKDINAALANPKLQARFADLGGTVLPGSPADFGKLIADETEKWAKVIRAANIKPE